MAERIVNSDQWVSEQAAWSRAKHVGEVYTLRLFANNFVPNPGHHAGDFTEASFAGYAAVDVSTLWGAPFQVVQGEYQHSTSVVEFTSDDVTGQQIYGWYMTRADGSVDHSATLVIPVFMVDPQVLRLGINYHDWAIILL